jgi:hypothetical protein
MKPCSKNRKPLALLAIDALEASRATELREHLEVCPNCRAYFDEIGNVAKSFSELSPEKNSSLSTSASFHNKVVNAIRETEAGSFWSKLYDSLRSSPNFLRFAPGVVAAAMLVIIFAALLHPKPDIQQGIVPKATSPAAIKSDKLPSPTFSNYQLVASRSLEDLDQLLTRQSQRNLPVSPLYRASNLSDSNSPD